MLPKLIKNKLYKFIIKDFETPFGDIVKTEPKERVFLGKVNMAPKGFEKQMFLKVKRLDNDRVYVICEDAIESIVEG